jgi:hypothetical protein
MPADGSGQRIADSGLMPLGNGLVFDGSVGRNGEGDSLSLGGKSVCRANMEAGVSTLLQTT